MINQRVGPCSTMIGGGRSPCSCREDGIFWIRSLLLLLLYAPPRPCQWGWRRRAGGEGRGGVGRWNRRRSEGGGGTRGRVRVKEREEIKGNSEAREQKGFLFNSTVGTQRGAEFICKQHAVTLISASSLLQSARRFPPSLPLTCDPGFEVPSRGRFRPVSRAASDNFFVVGGAADIGRISSFYIYISKACGSKEQRYKGNF